jgi:ribosome-binding protein aMBF1 (putative translation factor)
MIKNQKHASITREKLAELQEALADLKQKEAQSDPLEYELAMNSITAMIADLEAQLKEYKELKAGNFCHTPESLNDIPKSLIAARLALGLSHKDLADRLGKKEQQMQRYEASDYETCSFARIVEVADVLGVTFSFKQAQLEMIPRKVCYDFLLPGGITDEQVKCAEKNFNRCLMPVNE